MAAGGGGAPPAPCSRGGVAVWFQRRMRKLYRVVSLACAAAVITGAGVWIWKVRGAGGPPAKPGAATFARDVAPVLYTQCAGCHRPDGPAPFSLLGYADAKKHAAKIADVTARRYMPPWQPEPGYGHFAGEHRLTDDQIALLGRWRGRRAPRATRPPPPRRRTSRPGGAWGSRTWSSRCPRRTRCRPRGTRARTFYRNFVIPIPLDSPRYVRTVEIRPGNPRCVHHAFALFDRTKESRRLDEKDPGPGFGGMDAGGAQSPGGQFLSWQPGKVPVPGDPDTAWRLDPGTDLVVQLHLRPSGKPETVRPSVGLYFSNTPLTRQAFKLRLASLLIDVPPGAKDYAVEDTYKLPVNVELREILPHAHYLAKEIRGRADLPDGTTRELLWIKDWDFNWQGEYRYAEPLQLPRGTVLSMRMTFDNSADNPRNPNRPPKRVTYGPQTSDEMAELWLQVVPRRREDLAALSRDFAHKRLSLVIERVGGLVKEDPNDADKRMRLGKALLADGRAADALAQFRAPSCYGPSRPRPTTTPAGCC